MKKLFYIIALVFVCALAVTACTEEEVKPAASAGSSGASNDPM